MIHDSQKISGQWLPVTKATLELNWGPGISDSPTQHFRCALCGHKFVEDDHYMLICTADIPGTYGSPLVCNRHGSVERMKALYLELCEQFRKSQQKFWFMWKNYL